MQYHEYGNKLASASFLPARDARDRKIISLLGLIICIYAIVMGTLRVWVRPVEQPALPQALSLQITSVPEIPTQTGPPEITPIPEITMTPAPPTVIPVVTLYKN